MNAPIVCSLAKRNQDCGRYCLQLDKVGLYSLPLLLTCMQTDKKNLGTKAMLAEIRELGEKFKPADDVPEALGATFPFSARLRPFLALDCTDRYGCQHDCLS